MKPQFEKIIPSRGSSFRLIHMEHGEVCAHPSKHFHPEYEIVFISNGRGKRHINEHVSYFEDGDLIFLGPDLPHFGFTDEISEPHTQTVVQLKPDFLGEAFWKSPEMGLCRLMFERAAQGLSFYGETRNKVGQLLVQLDSKRGLERLSVLLQALHLMANSKEFEILQTGGFYAEITERERKRLNTIFSLTENKFREKINLEQIAGSVNMTVSAFCRYFKKLTGKTYTEFTNEFRINHACRLLTEEDLSIADTGFESGFANLSHFNRIFKKQTGLTPSQYRKQYTKTEMLTKH